MSGARAALLMRSVVLGRPRSSCHVLVWHFWRISRKIEDFPEKNRTDGLLQKRLRIPVWVKRYLRGHVRSALCRRDDNSEVLSCEIWPLERRSALTEKT